MKRPVISAPISGENLPVDFVGSVIQGRYVELVTSGTMDPTRPGCSELLDEHLAAATLVVEIGSVLENYVQEYELCCGPWD